MEADLRKLGAGEEEKRVESNGKEVIFFKDNLLESTKAKIGEVREENQRLKMHLNRIMKDYQTLQMQILDIVKQEAKKSTNLSSAHNANKEHEESHELTSLSLGRTLKDPIKDENPRKGPEDQQDYKQGGLALELCNKEAGESWPPGKVLKTMRNEENEFLQQNPDKKARVSVRIRCDTPMMNDGCQWRKYGQKIAKGNPCPRAYYRCTLAPTCPVRKQVQRCVEDMSILISTYEGTHNHPLPPSATAMASTTSAAASTLLCGSSTSGTVPSSSVGTTTSSSDFQGMNFYLSDNSNSNLYYLPSSSISYSPSYPTITLDLTSTSSSSYLNKMFSNSLSTPRFSTTNPNFSSLESNGVLNYGTQVPYNKHQVDNSFHFGPGRNQENFYHSFNHKGLTSNHSSPQQTLPTDAIAAATKAITSDPSFQSALATALTSIIGTSGGGGGGNREF